MDWAAIGDFVSRVGPAGILFLFIGFLGRFILSNEARHKSEINRINEAHDAELKELRSDIADLRKDVDTLHTMLGQERLLRFAAENETQRLRLILVGGLRNEEEA